MTKSHVGVATLSGLSSLSPAQFRWVHITLYMYVRTYEYIRTYETDMQTTTHRTQMLNLVE